jgi:hypothetical protein
MKRTHLLTIRINPRKRTEFKVASDLLGVPMSSLLHQVVFEKIQEVKTRYPREFEKGLKKSLAVS